VSVGILEGEVSQHLRRELPTFAIYTALALAVGCAAALLLARRLKRSTFGLELHEIASLLQEREAMLHGVREGVVTFDQHGRLTLVNDEARRLLGLSGDQVGAELAAMLPEGRLRDVLAGEVLGPDQVVLTDEHCLVVNRMPVSLAGRDLGAVVTVRDRTEVEGLVRELDNVRGLTDALRAQQHEFANRMHTLAGLLELGHHEEALAYVTETGGLAGGRAEAVQDRIANPLVVGLVLAKATIAAERGVDLVLTDDSCLTGPSANLTPLLTVLGNLVDNAVDAAASGPRPARVTVHLAEDADGVLVRVRDTGPGVPAEAVGRIFQDGFSTKTPRGGVHRGLGLALVHRLVQRAHGTITVSRGQGAEFTVRLPDPADELAEVPR
jgi:two-component system CitB family sensor kinase